MCELIEWYKRKFFSTNNFAFKNLWLKKAGDRLVWLSNQKNEIIKSILNKIQDKKALIFCNSIEQTEILGEYCINSTNADSMTYLNMFNNNEINHITACNILNEGVNLTACQVGLYASLNSSETMVKQKLGRILRHQEPIIIIPYYKNTREEELVDKMKEDYNPDNIRIIENLNELTF
jgi:superfamily II DNA or RNA helicase